MVETELKENGLYIIDDRYFQRFSNHNLMWNKSESRPNYYAVKDKDGIFWMIPLSSQLENYKAKAAVYRDAHKGADCVYYEFAQIASKERVFLIGNMFPVTAEFILRPYTISGIDYIVKDTKAIARIQKKVKKYLNLLERGVLKSSANVLDIKRQLTK